MMAIAIAIAGIDFFRITQRDRDSGIETSGATWHIFAFAWCGESDRQERTMMSEEAKSQAAPRPPLPPRLAGHRQPPPPVDA